jgi:hypothetical protein
VGTDGEGTSSILQGIWEVFPEEINVIVKLRSGGKQVESDYSSKEESTIQAVYSAERIQGMKPVARPQNGKKDQARGWRGDKPHYRGL